MNPTEIKQYIDQEVSRRVQNELNFVYNIKYRFERPVEFPRAVTIGDSPVIVRAENINIANLPTSATGLDTGQLYNDSGTVKVA